MARTRTKPNNLRDPSLADWFLAHSVAQNLVRPTRRQGPIHDYVNFLWPVNLDYGSPLNPIFLVECMNPTWLQAPMTWLVRDGLVPLLWFFRTNPTPEGFRGKLLIQEDLATFVPPAWRKACGTYAIHSVTASPLTRTTKGARKKPKGLLLVGIMMDTYASLPWLKDFLKSLVRQGVPTQEILAFLPGRFDGWGTEHRHEYHIEFTMELSRQVGTKVKALNWNEFEAIQSFEDYWVVDVNEGLLCVDTYLLHRALSRGGTLPASNGDKPPMKTGEEFVSLSPFHGVKLSPTLDATYSLKPSNQAARKTELGFRQFETVMKSEANLRFPWPGWFPFWAKMQRTGATGNAPAPGEHSSLLN